MAMQLRKGDTSPETLLDTPFSEARPVLGCYLQLPELGTSQRVRFAAYFVIAVRHTSQMMMS